METIKHKDFILELNLKEIEEHFSGKDLNLKEYKLTPKIADFSLLNVGYNYKDSLKKFVIEVDYKTLNTNHELISKSATLDIGVNNFQFKNVDDTQWLSMSLGTVKHGEHKGKSFNVRYILINDKKIVMFHPEDMLKAIEANKDSEEKSMSLLFAIRGAIYNIYAEDLDIYGLDVK
ncbi:hypothetical protein [Acinetobacter baumannii]|uniref:hypothetical protein n=1 Tax=Acinetobacter baumannii TaxID=470 RepID=UPI000DF26B2B|nr:hypothetical protein [Acinetobacter baumannii]RCT89701.1 hypothetical protein DVA68_16015 [Acinetobacter baumannii]